MPTSEEQIPLNSQEAYQALLNTNDTKTIKIFLSEADESKDHLNSSEYDVISTSQRKEENIEEYKTGEVKKEKPSLENVVKDVTESVVFPQVQKLPYFSYMPMQDEHLQKMIRAVVQEQIPVIVSKVKEAVLQELRPLVLQKPKENPVVILEPELKPVQQEVEKKAHVHIFDEPIQKVLDVDHLINVEDELHPAQEMIIPVQKEDNFIDRIKRLGNVIKEQVSDFPEKAKNALDDWSHKIEGDPRILVEEGKYPRSVIEKADKLKEIFIDESRKDLLEFVNRYPRTVNLHQLAHLFIVKDQPQEQEQEEVIDFQQNNEQKEQQRLDEN